MQHTIIITGPQGSGKTTLVLEVVQRLQHQGLVVGGIAALGYWKDDVRDRFNLLDLQTGEKMVFCQQKPRKGWEQLRRFYVNPAGHQFGEKALDPENLKEADLIVIDEIGPFELQGKGWAKALDRIFSNVDKPLLITVREGQVKEITETLIPGKYVVFHVAESGVEIVVEEIVSLL